MPALFPRWTNTAYRLGLAALICTALGGLVGAMVYVRTPWNTGQYDAVDQPVQFDHRHHVIDDRIDCVYCHSNAERSDFAGVPSTEVCMGCHAQVWNESPLLETVRRSYFSGRPIPWNRVHDLPDFVYFNHAVHVQRGVGCVACHGRVDEMARVYKVASLQMGWCLDCHQNAGEYVRSEAQARALTPVAGEMVEVTSEQPALLGTYPLTRVVDDSLGPRKLDALTTCTACHR
jgi:cytochrome c7-like protein